MYKSTRAQFLINMLNHPHLQLVIEKRKVAATDHDMNSLGFEIS